MARRTVCVTHTEVAINMQFWLIHCLERDNLGN